MPAKTIYLADKDEKVVREALRIWRGSFSSLVAKLFKEYVETEKTREKIRRAVVPIDPSR